MRYSIMVLGGATAISLIFFGAAEFGIFQHGHGMTDISARPNENLSLVTEPTDGVASVLRMISKASTTVDLVMYELDDWQLEDALVAANDRGVIVRVLLSQGYYGEPSKVNGPAYQYFLSKGVAVRWTPAYFALTHEKALIVDGYAAMIMTFNLMPQYYVTSRDFGIIDADPDDVNAIEAAFGADWRGSRITPAGAQGLIWSPGSENATVALIGSATSTLDVYNEEMADTGITHAFKSAAQRGVHVRIIMTYASEWKTAFRELVTAGVQVRTYSPKASLYIHAKMILADSAEAFVGSQNFSVTSQNENRELGLLLADPMIIKSLSSTFESDWKNATLSGAAR